MGASPRGATWRPSRGLHHSRFRIVLIILALVAIHQHRLFFIYRHALLAKYSPTIFSTDFQHIHSSFEEDSDRLSLKRGLLANREDWKVLGSGWEGTTYTYNGSVIKTFKAGRSPLRNCMPGAAKMKWPTEMPASLYFGHLPAPNFTKFSMGKRDAAIIGFLPVQTYFMASTSSSSPLEWHLVTPLLEQGNLVQLSNRLRMSEEAKGLPELDAYYRPAFNLLLRSLAVMHRAGFCHDDIKPSNIFVGNVSHWFLGDLGNVRHISHPYHFSRIWSENKQLSDCRANDVVRLLKSYLQFLRVALDDADAFNAEFSYHRGSLARLFWDATFNSQNLTAEALWHRSLEEAPSQLSTPTMTVSSDSARSHALFHELLSELNANSGKFELLLRTRIGEQTARWFALTWIFGVPETAC